MFDYLYNIRFSKGKRIARADGAAAATATTTGKPDVLGFIGGMVGSLSSMFGSIFAGAGNPNSDEGKDADGTVVVQAGTAKSNTGMYVIIGLVAVAVIGVLIWVIKRKK